MSSVDREDISYDVGFEQGIAVAEGVLLNRREMWMNISLRMTGGGTHDPAQAFAEEIEKVLVKLREEYGEYDEGF